MKFSESVDRWFDRLAVSQDPACFRIRAIASKFPVKSNLKRLRMEVLELRDSDLRNAILDTINSLPTMTGHKGEFRYLWHRTATTCSACGELFSMLRQSIQHQLV